MYLYIDAVSLLYWSCHLYYRGLVSYITGGAVSLIGIDSPTVGRYNFYNGRCASYTKVGRNIIMIDVAPPIKQRHSFYAYILEVTTVVT